MVHKHAAIGGHAVQMQRAWLRFTKCAPVVLKGLDGHAISGKRTEAVTRSACPVRHTRQKRRLVELDTGQFIVRNHQKSRFIVQYLYRAAPGPSQSHKQLGCHRASDLRPVATGTIATDVSVGSGTTGLSRQQISPCALRPGSGSLQSRFRKAAGRPTGFRTLQDKLKRVTTASARCLLASHCARSVPRPPPQCRSPPR
jgi:hypothetical protein